MKKIIFTLALFSFAARAFSAGFALNTIKAADIGAKAAAVAIPVPAAPARAEAPVAPDLLSKFQKANKDLNAMSDGLTWAGDDMARLEERARQIIQMHVYDSFFESDLRKMSSDMSRRFEDMRLAAKEVHDLLALAQKSAELSKSAKDMDRTANSILRDAWPALQDAAQRLESTVSSGAPEVIGYDSQWTASDISRNCRQLTDQARRTVTDTQKLVALTQP